MKTFPTEVINAAVASQAKYGVAASVTLAQWALESDYGQRTPVGSNNPFGIKAVRDQPYIVTTTHEVIDGKSIKIAARFRKFDSIAEAFDAHANLLANGKPYVRLKTKLGDYIALSKGLTGLYATDPHYGEKLINIIDNYRLYTYDKAAK